MAKGKNTVATVTELAEPLAARMGLIIWDIRFEKEGAGWYLRIFLDKEEGIGIDDCENFSRAVDKLLDEADPIDQSYILEVGSPGIERELRKGWHFEAYLGDTVTVRLIRPVEGQRDFVGELAAFENDEITLLLDDEMEMKVPLAETAYVRLYVDYENMGGLDE